VGLRGSRALRHEKRLALPLVVSSTLLFLAGHALLLLHRLRQGVQLHLELRAKSITVAPDIEAYFNFVLGMFLAFGVAFECRSWSGGAGARRAS
jgi:sec-independent protein translocase protein TatC